MKEIQLTQGQVALVDDEDYEWLSQYKWHAKKYKNTFYAMRTPRDENGKQINVGMHRMIMGMPSNINTDHIDGNGLNNQRSNLRICTSRQNSQNIHKNKASQYPGVNWEKAVNKWRAQIGINGKNKHLGLYEDEIDAFRAYYDAVLALGQEILDFPYPHKIRDGIYLLVGASGSGKTTLSQELINLGIPEIKSHSTRQMREGESEGQPYFFVTPEEFAQIPMIERTEYAGQLYGTSKQEIERILAENSSAFAIVDAHGVKAFKQIYGDTVKVIYIHAPFCKLIQRMKARNDPPEVIAQRVRHALDSNEQSNIDLADYCIINLDLDEAKRLLRCIVGV